MRLLLLLVLNFGLIAFAAEEVLIRPVVSKKGVERIFQAVETVDANIKDTQQNITLCEKNRSVVLAEVKELEKLEQEQRELIVKYKIYLNTAREMIDKNDVETAKVEKFEKENKSKLEQLKGPAQVDLATKMHNAKQDRAQREKWKADSTAKTNRVQKLLNDAQANLSGIQSRKPSLQRQASEWVQRQDEFKKLLKELSDRKEQLARLGEAKRKELPPEEQGSTQE